MAGSSKRGLLLVPPLLIAALVCAVWFVGRQARAEQLREAAELIRLRGEDQADLDELHADLLGDVEQPEPDCLERVTEAVTDLQDVRSETLLTFREREAHLLSGLGPRLGACAGASSPADRGRTARTLVRLSESEPSHPHDLNLMLNLWEIQDDIEASAPFGRAWDLVKGDTNERLRAIRERHDAEVTHGRPWGEVVADGFELHPTTSWNVRQLRLLAFLVDTEATRAAMADMPDPLVFSHGGRIPPGWATIDGEETDHVGAHMCARHGFERMRELSGGVHVRLVPTEAGVEATIEEHTLDEVVAICIREALRLVPVGEGERTVFVEVIPRRPGLSSMTGTFE